MTDTRPALNDQTGEPMHHDETGEPLYDDEVTR